DRYAHPAGAVRRHQRRRARVAGLGRGAVVRQRAHRAFSTMKRPIARTSSGVLKKASIAALGEPTIGSPRTLNEVLTSTGTPLRRAKARNSAWKRGWVPASTVCTRAVRSVWHADGMRAACPAG